MSAGVGSNKAVTKTASLLGNVGLGGPVGMAWTAYQWYDTARWAANSIFGGEEEKEL